MGLPLETRVKLTFNDGGSFRGPCRFASAALRLPVKFPVSDIVQIICVWKAKTYV